MKKQILIIGGGDTFASEEDYLNFLKNFPVDLERYRLGADDWKPWLQKMLGEEYEVYKIVMPNVFNAQYNEWKIWFKKFIPQLNDGLILVGHSLGGSFLAKYLSENKFPRKISAVMLVAAAYTDNPPEDMLLGFTPPDDLSNFSSQAEKVFLYHSKDDPVVKFSDVEKFAQALPNAELRIFEDRKHLNIEEFPELLEDIKSLES